MIIECTECGTRYEIEDGKITPPGKMARCSRCQKIFFVDLKSDGDYESVSIDETKSFSSNEADGIDEFDLQENESVDWDNVTISNPELGVSDNTENNNDLLDMPIEEHSENPFKAPEPVKLETDVTEEDMRLSSFSKTFEQNTAQEENLTEQKVYRSSSKKKSSGPFVKFFSFVMSLLTMVIITVTILYVLGTIGVIPKDKFESYKSIVLSKLPYKFDYNEYARYASVRNVETSWINTKNGYLFLVKGEVVNKHKDPISYIKLRNKYYSADEELYTQELFSGNTFTVREIKNSSYGELLRKLKKKGGDIDFDDVDTFKGRNFDIKPGRAVPFYSFYLTKSKILGLKYDIEIIELDVLGVN